MEPGNKTILDVFIKILRSLECPVCYEYVSPPIYQCNSGHILCGKCKKDIQNCPECRSLMPKELRARKLEELSEEMIYPCRNIGCDNIVTAKELQAHEKNCPHFSGKVREEESKYNHQQHTVLLHHIEQTIAPFLEIKSDKISLDEEIQTDLIEMMDATTSTHYQDSYEKGPYFMSGVMVPVASLSKEALVKGHEKQIYGFLDSAKNYLGRHLNNNKPYNFPQINLSESLNEMHSISNSFTSGIEQCFSSLGDESSWGSINNTVKNSFRNSKYSLHEKYERGDSLQDTLSEVDSSNIDSAEEETLNNSVEVSSDLSKSNKFSELLCSLLDKQNESSNSLSSLKWPASSTSKQASTASENVKSDNNLSQNEINIKLNETKPFAFNFEQFDYSNSRLSQQRNSKYLMKLPRRGQAQKSTDGSQSQKKTGYFNFEKNHKNIFVFKGQSENSDGAQSNPSYDLPKININISTTENDEIKIKSSLFNFNDVNDKGRLDSYAKKAEQTFNNKEK